MAGRKVCFRDDLVSEVTVVERLDAKENQDLYYRQADYRRFRCECKVEGIARATLKKNGDNALAMSATPRQRKLYQAPTMAVKPHRKRFALKT